MRRQQRGIRLDKIIGLMTIIATLVFAFMIYSDYKGIFGAEDVDAEADFNQSNLAETLATLSPKTTVCIDPGHGGSDVGADSQGLYEKNQTLSVSLKVKEYLESAGINVVMTRTTDTDVSLENRVKICNDAGSVAMVSIHRNYYEGFENVYGAETWIHSSQPSDSIKLANGILSSLKKNVDEDNRGVKYGTIEDINSNYYINSKSKCASCILELGFITSPADTPFVTTKLDATAKSIADGIMDYLKTMGYTNE